MTQFAYRRHGQVLSFYEGEHLLFSGTEISVAYDPDTFTVLKHGPSHLIAEWAKGYRAQLVANKAQHLLSVSTIDSADWNDEELTRIIGSVGYLKIFMKEMK